MSSGDVKADDPILFKRRFQYYSRVLKFDRYISLVHLILKEVEYNLVDVIPHILYQIYKLTQLLQDYIYKPVSVKFYGFTFFIKEGYLYTTIPNSTRHKDCLHFGDRPVLGFEVGDKIIAINTTVGVYLLPQREKSTHLLLSKLNSTAAALCEVWYSSNEDTSGEDNVIYNIPNDCDILCCKPLASLSFRIFIAHANTSFPKTLDNNGCPDFYECSLTAMFIGCVIQFKPYKKSFEPIYIYCKQCKMMVPNTDWMDYDTICGSRMYICGYCGVKIDKQRVLYSSVYY